MYAEQHNDEVTPRCEVYQAAPAHPAQTHKPATKTCHMKAYVTLQN